jgi:hypothetical protein
MKTSIFLPLLFTLVLGVSAYGQETEQVGEQPRLSDVEGVPLPDEAEFVSMSEVSLIATYHTPDMSFDALEAWYEERLPAEQGWADWTWCEYKDRETFTQRTYHRPDTAEILVIVLIREEPNGILISYGEDQPC